MSHLSSSPLAESERQELRDRLAEIDTWRHASEYKRQATKRAVIYTALMDHVDDLDKLAREHGWEVLDVLGAEALAEHEPIAVEDHDA